MEKYCEPASGDFFPITRSHFIQQHSEQLKVDNVKNIFRQLWAAMQRKLLIGPPETLLDMVSRPITVSPMRIALIILVLATFFTWLFYTIQFGFSISKERQDWIDFATFFSGILSPIYTVVGFGLLFYQIKSDQHARTNEPKREKAIRGINACEEILRAHEITKRNNSREHSATMEKILTDDSYYKKMDNNPKLQNTIFDLYENFDDFAKYSIALDPEEVLNYVKKHQKVLAYLLETRMGYLKGIEFNYGFVGMSKFRNLHGNFHKSYAEVLSYLKSKGIVEYDAMTVLEDRLTERQEQQSKLNELNKSGMN